MQRPLMIHPLIFFVVTFLHSDIVFGQNAGPSDAFRGLEELTIETIWQLRRDAYDSAFATISHITSNYPQAPNGYLLAADAYQTMMRDYRIRLFEAEFDKKRELQGPHFKNKELIKWAKNKQKKWQK